MVNKVKLDVAGLNKTAWQLLLDIESRLSELKIEKRQVAGATVYDFGVEVPGSNEAGVLLAQVSAGGNLDVAILPNAMDFGTGLSIAVESNNPVPACLGSQYAGWPLAVGKYFAMTSGPIRGVRGRESIFKHFDVGTGVEVAVAVLESDRLPSEEVVIQIAKECQLQAHQLVLCVAPTASLAGTLQVVARSLETALHQWETLGGDLNMLVSGKGVAPLPAVAKDSLTGIGWTNDAIIFHGEVFLQLSQTAEASQKIAEQLPSLNSQSFGKNFLTLFQECGNDFYKMDPRLFSPARVWIAAVGTKQDQSYGALRPDLFKESTCG
jgi:methenyltetrahydromethanopterin cyclohydrolase